MSPTMTLTCKIGGPHAAFADETSDRIAGLLDHAFGSESDWESPEALDFGRLTGGVWNQLCDLAQAELGAEAVPNLLALRSTGGGVFLPAPIQAVTLPLSDQEDLPCASLPGLRSELAELALRWDLPQDDAGLHDLLRISQDPDDGLVADAPEVTAFARLALAANEAVRRDCPLWLVDE